MCHYEIRISTVRILVILGGKSCREREKTFIDAGITAGRGGTRSDSTNPAKADTVRFTGESYQEVKIKLIALRSATKEAVSSGRLTVKEVFEEWLSAVKLRVKESTYAN